MGHANAKWVCDTLDAAGIQFDFENDEVECPVCHMVNFRRITTRYSASEAPRFLFTLSTDMFPLPVRTWNNKRYCQFIIDKYSRYVWVLWFYSKKEFGTAFPKFCRTLEERYNKKIVQIRGDSGELTWGVIQDYCESHEPNQIELKLSPPYTQALNGAAERSLGIYRARASCLLATSSLPYKLFNFAMEYAVDIGRNLIDKKMGKTPYETVHGVKPDYTRFHPFGCLVAVYVPKEKRRDWIQPLHKAEAGIFLGWKSQRIIFVYKFRTKLIHEEFQVTFIDAIFPGLTANTERLSRYITQQQFQFDKLEEIEGAPAYNDVNDSRSGPEELIGEPTEITNSTEFDGVQQITGQVMEAEGKLKYSSVI